MRKLREFQVDPVIKSERVKVRVIGRRSDLSPEMNKEIDAVEKLTEDHDRFQLNIAISYGGRAEIVDAVKTVANEVKDGKLDVDAIDENTFAKYLYTDGIPDPDLIIRTSGEERLAGSQNLSAKRTTFRSLNAPMGHCPPNSANHTDWRLRFIWLRQ